MAAGTSATGPRWSVEHHHGDAAVLHGLDIPDHPRRTVRIMHLGRRALVLGSTQSLAVVDSAAVAAQGVDVVVRRSGGGAVLLDPRSSLWVEVVVPRDDAWWDDDVHRSFAWVGDTWARALGQLGLDAAVHRGPLQRSPASASVCFAGLGPGEVTVAGAKAVGISQRRTRAGARFQCVLPLAGGPPAPAVLELLVEPAAADEREARRRHLDAAVASLAFTPDAVIAAFLAALPA